MLLIQLLNERFLSLVANGLQLPEGGDSKHFTVNQAQTLIEARSLI